MTGLTSQQEVSQKATGVKRATPNHRLEEHGCRPHPPGPHPTSWGFPAITAEGGIREGAWVAEAIDLVDLSKWPVGTRRIVRKERPHPGAQSSFTDCNGHRITGFLTDTPDGVIPGQLAGLELRHRQHARIEDRIRQAKATGLRNLPFHSFQANSAWLEVTMAATDLVAWAELIGFTDHPDLARCEIQQFRYRVLHVAARITRSARQLRIRIDATWRWVQAIAPPDLLPSTLLRCWPGRSRTAAHWE